MYAIPEGSNVSVQTKEEEGVTYSRLVITSPWQTSPVTLEDSK